MFYFPFGYETVYAFVPLAATLAVSKDVDPTLGRLTPSEQEAINRVGDQLHTRKEYVDFVKGLRN